MPSQTTSNLHSSIFTLNQNKNATVPPHLFYFRSIKKLSPLEPPKNKTHQPYHHDKPRAERAKEKPPQKQTEQPHKPPTKNHTKNKSLAAFKR